VLTSFLAAFTSVTAWVTSAVICAGGVVAMVLTTESVTVCATSSGKMMV